MSQRVRAGRAAVVAAVLAMAYVVALYMVRPVPDWAVGMLGGPGRPIERHGGLSLSFRPAPGSEAAFEAYVARHGQVARKAQGLFVVEFPGLPEDAATETVELLRDGGLVIKEVVRASYATEIGAREGVTVEVDQWRSDEGGALRTDPYLQAYSAEAMQAAIAGYQPPAGTEIAFEWVQPDAYATDPRPYLRTYLVKSEVAIDGSRIANATLSYDPNTNRPIVLLDFDRIGGEQLCELTARILGEKLATITGGRVRSAPIITGRICGGRASVMMGGSDPRHQEREASALVAVLNGGAVPPGTIERQAWTPAANVANQEWAARLLFGLVAGLVLGALVLVIVRATRPTVHAPGPRPAGAMPWRRVLVTALGPAVLYIGSHYVTLPAVNDVELQHLMRGRDAGMITSVFALGVTPIITAYVLVELVALAWPRLRWRRHDPRGRIGLGRAVAVLAMVIALAQGYFVAQYLERMSYGGAEVVMSPGYRFQLLTMVTLAAGTALLALLAGVIREHGLGNGYAVLLASSFVLELGGPYLDGAVTHSMLLGGVGAAGIAVATRALLRWRVDGLRLPTCGVTPISDGGGIVLLLVTLSSIGLGDQLFDAFARVNALRASVAWNVIVIVISVPLWSWLFARPTLVEGTTLRTWLRATGLTLLGVVGIGLVGISSARTDQLAALLAPLSVMLVTATVLDVVDDLRARRQRLVPAGILHQAQHVAKLERALAAANIPAHFHASHVRTLYAFFGPWAPILVLVPEAHGEAAQRIVYATVTTEHHAVVQAFARDARPTPDRPLVPAWARTT